MHALDGAVAVGRDGDILGTDVFEKDALEQIVRKAL